MNLSKLQGKLIAAARADAPADRVPYAFEQRIMARLANTRPEDAWALWGKALWRSAVACAALAIALTIWSFQSNGEIEHDLASTMFYPAEQLADTW